MPSNIAHLWPIAAISVLKPSSKVIVNNPTRLEMIGSGHEGAVFRINGTRCVKIFGKKKVARRELYALQLAQRARICPEVYDWGSNWILMAYIDAPTVSEHLKSHPLTEELSERLIVLLKMFKTIGYTRLDHSPKSIFLLPDGSLRVIGVARSISRSGEMKTLPKKLLKGLGQYAPEFLRHVRRIRPMLYVRWIRHPDFASTMAKATKQEVNAFRPWWRRLASTCTVKLLP